MKLGFCTNGSSEELQLGREIGFKSIELIIDLQSPYLPGRPGSEKRLLQLKEQTQKSSMEITAIGFYPNYLAQECKERQQLAAYFRQIIEMSARIEVPLVCTFAGRDPNLEFEANLPLVRELFIPLAEKAGELNLKIAFENCPVFTREMMIGNLAATPRGWDMIFEALPYPHIGLEYDPSHLIRLGIDYMRALNQYQDKIFHVHAKDGERIEENIYQYSLYDNLHSIYRDRFPGLGEVDWRQLISTLYHIQYQSNLDIEGKHDPFFKPENEARGLRLAYQHLDSFLI